MNQKQKLWNKYKAACKEDKLFLQNPLNRIISYTAKDKLNREYVVWKMKELPSFKNYQDFCREEYANNI